mmetsp:Transcript_98206/g.173472  ORF Transcript_98206/g.173472 Transcript_98206/m.173472 type:complete len:116 (+) Transcript_98206:803-1150(+)
MPLPKLLDWSHSAVEVTLIETPAPWQQQVLQSVRVWPAVCSAAQPRAAKHLRAPEPALWERFPLVTMIWKPAVWHRQWLQKRLADAAAKTAAQTPEQTQAETPALEIFAARLLLQ